MPQQINLRLLPSEASSHQHILQALAKETGNPLASISGYYIIKRSIDARSKTIWINLTVKAFINEPVQEREKQSFHFKDVRNAKRSVVIIGAGPAGLFAALQLIELGIKPILLERGKDVQSRRRDLALLNKSGILNPESNYCFGEGGAGTYSDGKLYTRSNKRGNIDRILQIFVHFGATENILTDVHPHIGTNKLPQIITAMREQIIESGGVYLFEKKMTGLQIEHDQIKSITTADGDRFTADAFILATGHSARDIFHMLQENKIQIEAKPFALGVRIEHPQQLIDQIQYHCPSRGNDLPPAAYSLVQQINDRGVFSFCMCPGGIIAPASTATGELVVNGWSPSKRNNPYANSGMVVQVEMPDALQSIKKNGKAVISANADPLLFLQFQQMVEQACYTAGGGKFIAPAQRMADFSAGKLSTSLPQASYQPGLRSIQLKEVLPDFIYQSLAKAFIKFGKKMPGYFTNEAIVVATESRTSSPVRIPRNPETLAHTQLQNLYPCGEGAGYAGGIVSAAMDGERIALVLGTLLY